MSLELPRIDYRGHPAYGGMFEPDPALRGRAIDLLQPLVDEMAKVESDRAARFGYRYGYAEDKGRELAEQGMTQFQLPGELIDKLHKRARPMVEVVQARVREAKAKGAPIRFKTVEERLEPEANGAIYKAADAFLREMEIYDLVARFFAARSSRINSLALFVNPSDQDWAARPFRDVDLPTPPTAGFHVDSNGKCYVKGILHLGDVGPDQGATGVVPGSHLWGQGGMDRIYRRAFDRSRLLARAAEERRLFVSLPEEMQVKAEFGGDMLPESPEAEDLLAREVRAVGPRGLLTLFDPEAIHRGGQVREGERQVMQIVLTAQY